MIDQAEQLSYLRRVFNTITGCCLADPAWLPDDVEQVLATMWSGSGWGYQEGLKDWGDTDSLAIVLLSDGSYGLMQESEDYTGHGCCCHSFTGRYSTLDELMTMGIPEKHGARPLITELLGDRYGTVRATPEEGPENAPRGSATAGT